MLSQLIRGNYERLNDLCNNIMNVNVQFLSMLIVLYFQRVIVVFNGEYAYLYFP